jgi:signal transduction histidine kinase
MQPTVTPVVEISSVRHRDARPAFQRHRQATSTVAHGAYIPVEYLSLRLLPFKRTRLLVISPGIYAPRLAREIQDRSDQRRATSPRSKGPDMHELKADILLVDDEPANLLALQGLLEPLEQNLLLARSGEDALRLALKHDFAVILLDVRMPGLDGFETARLIRERPRSQHTPIIFLTGVSAEMESAFRGYEVGAVDYLVKPLLPDVLRSKVSVFVELHKKNVELTREVGERKLAEQQLRESEEKLRALAARLISVREEERTRIAREIHDELGQVLTGLKMDVMWLGKRLPAQQKSLTEKIEGMGQLIDSTVNLVRGISSGLRPEILDEMGLLEAIKWQAAEFQKRMGIRCRVRLPAEQGQVDRDLSTTVFRIFQEVLTNVARHARATSVKVDLRIAPHELAMDVVDNGVGIADSEARGRHSLGLLGMQERAQLFGGEVRISGTPGKGTSVAVRIPLPPANGREPGQS